MRIYSLLPMVLLTCIVGTPGLADSHGKFPGKGSIDAYNKACDPADAAVAYAKKGDYDAAIKYDREAISIYPYDSATHHNLGNALAKLRRFDEARKSQETAIALEPNYDGAWISIGITYEDERKLIDAERCYRKAVELQPNGYQGVIDLGDILRQQGKFNEAREWLLKAKATPDTARFPGEADAKLRQCDLKNASN